MPDHPQKKQWNDLAAKLLKGQSPDSLNWMTPEGILVKPLYTAEDLEGMEHVNTLPGLPPYVRGPVATMYAGRPWTIRQYAGFSTARESNAFYRQNLAAGQKGLSVAFDLATHRGYDSDNPRVAGDVGKVGVAVDSVEDMKILFDRIPLDEMSVSMTMNGAVLPVLAGFIVAAEEQGVPQEKLTGTIQNDILKEYLTRNTYIYPPGPSMRIVSDIIGYCSRNMPKFNTVSISGYHMMEAGANSVLQTAFTLADGLEYVKAALATGLDIDAFAPRLSFFFGIGMNFFMDIAMLRAARFLWHELMKPFNPREPPVPHPQDPLPDVGMEPHPAGSLQQHHPHDAGMPLRGPRRDAVAAHQRLRRGGRAAHRIFRPDRPQYPDHRPGGIRDLPRRGSAGRLLLSGSPDRRHHPRSPQDHRRGRGPGRDGQGHRNRHAEAPDRRIGRPKTGPDRSGARCDRRREQIQNRGKTPGGYPGSDRCGRPGADRPAQGTEGRTGTPRRSARPWSISPASRRAAAIFWRPTIPAIRARATVGEVSEAMEKVFGRFVATTQCISGVYASEYVDSTVIEAIRKRCRDFAEKEGRRPRILMTKIGQDGHDRGIKVVATAFADLGFDVDISPIFQTPEEVARIAIENDVHLVGVSSLVAGHKTLVPQLIAALKAGGGDDIKVVVGGIIPPGDYEFLYNAGRGRRVRARHLDHRFGQSDAQRPGEEKGMTSDIEASVNGLLAGRPPDPGQDHHPDRKLASRAIRTEAQAILEQTPAAYRKSDPPGNHRRSRGREELLHRKPGDDRWLNRA